jgi:TPR repeat protein
VKIINRDILQKNYQTILLKIQTLKSKLFFKALILFIALLGNVSLSKAEVNFFAMADGPYSGEAYYLIEKELENIPKNAKFIIHLGDVKRKELVCPENDYKDFKNLLKRSPIPVFVIPGDNGYDICNNPVEAKRFWDQYVSEFEKQWKLKFIVTRQKGQKENFAFFLNDTLFVGINHFPKRKRDTAKFNKTMQNNIFWIKENLKKHKDQIETLIIFAHDFSGQRDNSVPYKVCGKMIFDAWKNFKEYKYFSNKFISLAQEFKKPILYMQGNRHCLHLDTPYKEASNIKRIVVSKIEQSPMVKVTIKDNSFQIDKRVNAKIDQLLKEANHGNVWSQYFLSLEKVKLKEYEEAKKWLIKASQQNFLPAKSKLAEIKYSNGQDHAQTFKFVQSALQHKGFKNDFKKNDVSTSYEKKITEFKRKIINQSTYEIYFLLGVMYDHGSGTTKDYKKAIKYYKKASKGLGNAHYNMASIYYNGFLEGKRDYKRARDSCLKGAAAGVMDCNFMLGWINLAGLGVKQDYKKAAKWFKDSTVHPMSSFNLGILYLNGQGVPKNKEKAMRFFQNAAEMGFSQAKELLESLKTQN